MEYRDYYKIIGVDRDATQDEIKHAYRKLARKYHPDVSKQPDAEARFKEVGEAYEVLKDPEKRAAYDQLGANWKAGQEFDTPPDWKTGFEFRGGGFPGGDGAVEDLEHGGVLAQVVGIGGGQHALSTLLPPARRCLLQRVSVASQPFHEAHLHLGRAVAK